MIKNVFNTECTGIKIGYVKKIGDPKEPALPCTCCLPKLACLLPNKVAQLYSLMIMMYDDLRYDPHMAMEDIGCDMIYVGDILGVSKKARGLGLGKELIKR